MTTPSLCMGTNEYGINLDQYTATENYHLVLLPMSSPFSRGLHFCRTRRIYYTMEGLCLLYLLMILFMRSGDVETNPGPNTAESVFSDMNYMKLAKDFPPCYYYDVGRYLGFSNAELQERLVKNEFNFTHAFNSLFKMWNYMQQSPHSNIRQLLADTLREIDSGRLSDRILNELPMQNSTAVLNAGRPQTEPLMDFTPSPSTVCELEYLELAQDIDPSQYYKPVGISLGIPSTQLQPILHMNEMNYIGAFMQVFMQWIMQQPPHSNKRQLLADKLREIGLVDLSNRLLNERPNKTALLIYKFGKWQTDHGMTAPARCTPSTSGQTWSQKDKLGGVIINVADALSDDGLRKLGVELGVQLSVINRALIANYSGGTKTCFGNVLMLVHWAENVELSKLIQTLSTALKRAGLSEVEEKFCTSRSRASKESNVLCDLYFSNLAEQIGSEWHRLGIRLGLNQADIEHITEDKLTAVDRILALLQLWKKRSSCTDKRKMVEELCNALSSCDRRDLAGDVKEAAGIS